ncbi:MAG: hypothetical protein IK032_00985 [Bacteroidales bacterium]|nr:hypothetical protein [Bacteroidales bacterium]MBR5027957.1 hypothetical protein [Bacteroidales bacterium]
MDPRRNEPGNWYLRNGHYDDISEERLTETMFMLKNVADETNTTLNQVISVYNAASRNRLTEVLLDSGDAFDSVVNDFKKWHSSDGFVRIKLSGDDLADEMRVKILRNTD